MGVFTFVFTFGEKHGCLHFCPSLLSFTFVTFVTFANYTERVPV